MTITTMRGHSIHRRDDAVNCGSGGGAETYTGLRIGSIFIIMATSMCAALFPVLARRTRWLQMCVPDIAFQVAKYFGSGVIIATAFIHLLDPAMDELGSECLSAAWQEYPYALAICLGSIFMIFIIEIAAFRWGTAVLSKAGFAYDAHGHGLATGANAAHGPEHGTATESTSEKDTINEVGAGDIEAYPKKHLEQHEDAHAHAVGNFSDSAIAQIIGVAILEFGVLLHSIFVGLTLAVNEEFKILFVVIVFHQTFEGLGVGSRLAYMELPQKYAYFPVLGGVLYGLTTPVGIAAGLGVRSSYNPDGTTASIVSGILDAFSAGILIYTGLVELMAHEFIFNKEMMDSSNRHLIFAIGCMMLGAGLMALLGKWA